MPDPRRSVVVINWLRRSPDWSTHIEYPCDCFCPESWIYNTDEEAIAAADLYRSSSLASNSVRAAACWIEDILSAHRMRNL